VCRPSQTAIPDEKLLQKPRRIGPKRLARASARVPDSDEGKDLHTVVTIAAADVVPAKPKSRLKKRARGCIGGAPGDDLALPVLPDSLGNACCIPALPSTSQNDISEVQKARVATLRETLESSVKSDQCAVSAGPAVCVSMTSRGLVVNTVAVASGKEHEMIGTPVIHMREDPRSSWIAKAAVSSRTALDTHNVTLTAPHPYHARFMPFDARSSVIFRRLCCLSRRESGQTLYNLGMYIVDDAVLYSPAGVTDSVPACVRSPTTRCLCDAADALSRAMQQQPQLDETVRRLGSLPPERHLNSHLACKRAVPLLCVCDVVMKQQADMWLACMPAALRLASTLISTVSKHIGIGDTRHVYAIDFATALITSWSAAGLAPPVGMMMCIPPAWSAGDGGGAHRIHAHRNITCAQPGKTLLPQAPPPPPPPPFLLRSPPRPVRKSCLLLPQLTASPLAVSQPVGQRGARVDEEAWAHRQRTCTICTDPIQFCYVDKDHAWAYVDCVAVDGACVGMVKGLSSGRLQEMQPPKSVQTVVHFECAP
jgi:hypothetical protein